MTGANAPLLRSMLFVPADSDRKLARARASSADALILDLEDSVDVGRKASARERAAGFLAAERRRAVPRAQTLWLRINGLDGPDAARDLERVIPGRPDGIVLPKAGSAADVSRLAARLDELEARFSLEPGAISLLPIATETPAGVLALAHGGYTGSSERLAALTWGAEDLSAALGASAAIDERGAWLPTYELARSLCRLAAAAAGVPAVDTVHADFRDEAGLARSAQAAKRDGFAGKLAIHPAQIDVINHTFRPTRDEIERARRIIDAFESAPGTGVVSLDGRMLDRPHLLRARQVVAVAAAAAARHGA